MLPRLLSCIRFDHVSTEKIIQLSLDPQLRHQDEIVRAMCKRLAQAESARVPQELLSARQDESQSERNYTKGDQ